MTLARSTNQTAERRPGRWPMWCVLGLILASEYKFRLRENDQAISGSADLTVLLEIGVYAAVALFLFFRFRPTLRLHTADWVTYLSYAYVTILLLSSLYSPYVALAGVRACQVVVVLILVRSIARHTGLAAMHTIAHGFAVLVAASVVFGVLVPFPRLPSQPDRFTWLYLHPVDAGQFAAIAVVILTVYAFSNRLNRSGPRWPVPIYLVLLAICVAGLIGTNTRGAALGAVVGIFVCVWTRWRGSKKVEVASVLGAILVAIGLSGTAVIETFFTRGESAAQLATLNSRTKLWELAFEQFAKQPLYGHGLSASRGLFLDEIGLGGAHNALINLLVNTGILGAAIWLALLVSIVITMMLLARKSPEPRADRMFVLAMLWGLIANSVFTEGLGAPVNVACVWLLLLAGWASMAARTSRDQPHAEVPATTPIGETR